VSVWNCQYCLEDYDDGQNGGILLPRNLGTCPKCAELWRIYRADERSNHEIKSPGGIIMQNLSAISFEDWKRESAP
jgi:hypothetical protein